MIKLKLATAEYELGNYYFFK